MKVLLTGGGTGGHITPILAVAAKLKKQSLAVYITYVGERAGKFAHLTAGSQSIDETYTIFAGKFRRYHGESLLKKLLDVKTLVFNVRDLLFVSLGLLQSYFLLKKVKPDVVFLKGGFVGVPIGLAAAFLKIPIVTHDSDAVPGLANRIVGRWAIYHATGMPAEYYPYNPVSIRYVGVLVSEDYQPVNVDLQAEYKKDLGIADNMRILLITGGSHGAHNINKATATVVPKLLSKYDDLIIVHQVGKGKLGAYSGFNHDRLIALEFLDGMYRYTGAADVVVTRAGANTLAELGVQGRACIVIPHPHLAGAHQLKNGQYLKEQDAAIVLDEILLMDAVQGITPAIDKLLADPMLRASLGSKLQKITKANASEELANLLLEAGKAQNAKS